MPENAAPKQNGVQIGISSSSRNSSAAAAAAAKL